MATDNEGWYSNDSATFGDRVAAAREALGMTQKALAARLGVAIKTIEKWEDDLSEPRANKLQMLAGVLNVSMPWLLMGEGPGLDEPSGGEAVAEVGDILTEMRQLRGTLIQTGERLAVLEKRLKTTLGTAAE